MRSTRVFAALTLTTLAFLPCLAQRAGTQGEQQQVVQLLPSAFPALPANIVDALNHRGCLIPQHPESRKKHNVIKGEFTQHGQVDWAVLCSKSGFVSLLVFRNGDVRDVLTVSKTPLRNPFEVDIAPVGKKYIWDHYRAYGGPKPPPIDHQGIDYSFGMASQVAYYYSGKWYWLQGAD